jgi:hypothetical protein
VTRDTVVCLSPEKETCQISFLPDFTAMHFFSQKVDAKVVYGFPIYLLLKNKSTDLQRESFDIKESH